MAGKIVYKDIAPGAAEDAAFGASSKTDFSSLGLNDAPDNNSLITLEKNFWRLDGSFVAVGDKTVHFWSSDLSDCDGLFSVNPYITVEFSQPWTTVGITLVFDEINNEWCDGVHIKWYQDGAVKDEKDFSPNAASFFCANTVEAFNKLVIEFTKTNLPYRRARLDQILFGIIRQFGADKIRNASILMQTDLLSASLPGGTTSWTIDTIEPVEFLFQSKQPIEMYSDRTLVGVYYITDAKRQSATIYNANAQDAIGALSEQDFAGGAYLSGVSAKSLLQTIVGGAFELYMDGVTDATLYGVLEPQSKRDAMQQVLFAWGKLCWTGGDSGIHITELPTEPKEISPDNTFTGATLETATMVTEVVVTAHTYNVDANGGIEIGGQKYSDTETQYRISNPGVTANTVDNVVEASGTLVSTNNGQQVAQRVYDYYMRRNTHKSKILFNGEKLGDCLSQPTPWNTSEVGNVQKMTLSLSGIVVADVESLGVEK